MTNVQIITNEFYTSSKVFNAFLKDEKSQDIFKEFIHKYIVENLNMAKVTGR